MSFALKNKTAYLTGPWLMLLLWATTGGAEIIPTPKKVEYVPGTYQLKEVITVGIVNGGSVELLSAAKAINLALKTKMGAHTYLETDPLKADILLKIIPESQALSMAFPPDKLQDAYQLTITTQNILIEAPFIQGVFYGAGSLVQLIEQASVPAIDAQIVLDWSEFNIRGVADDISQGQVPTMENFKNTIRHLSRLKINTYLLSVQDVLFLDEYADLGENRDMLTKKEMREMVTYAKKHFVNVVPVFSTLNRHTDVLNLDQFQRMAEFTGSNALCPSCEFTYTYLNSVLKEIAEIFPSPYIHIGGSESFDAGYGKSAQLARELGLATLQAQHYKKVYDICKKYRKQVIMYSDLVHTYPEISNQLPDDIVYIDRQQPPQKQASNGTFHRENPSPYYVAPSLYADQSIFPHYQKSLPEIEAFARYGLSNRSHGLLSLIDYNNSAQLFKILLNYAHAWTAQCAWGGRQENPDEFRSSFFANFFDTLSTKLPPIYQKLSKAENNVSWNEFWSHPLLNISQSSYLPESLSPQARAHGLEADMAQVSQEIAALLQQGARPKDHLEVLNLVAGLNAYYAFKLKTQLNLQAYFNAREKNVEVLIPQIEENVLYLQKLKEQYAKVWNRYYRPEGLESINQRFDRLIFYFQESLDALLPGHKLGSPLIQSEWIYDCGSAADTAVCAQEAIFRRDFSLEKIPYSAQLQIMADTYAELYINGEFIDKLITRITPQTELSPEGIKIINIQKFLLEGNNTILIKATNHDQGLKAHNFPCNAAAGVNVYMLLRYDEKDERIITDKNWRAKLPGEGDKDWKIVNIKKYPYPVIEPNFLIERTSWIEK